MPPQFTIRPTRESDVIAYRELRLEALRNHPTAFGTDPATAEQRTLDDWRASMRAGSGDGSEVTYVAEAESELIGMMTLRGEVLSKMRHFGFVYGVYVRPAWRGAGVADALIAACIGWAQSRGLRLIKLAVTTTNVAAIRCYLRCGFSVYGVESEVIHWDGVYYDELLMARKLKVASEE